MGAYIEKYFKPKYELLESGIEEGELKNRLEYKYSKNFEKEYKKCKENLSCTCFIVKMSEYDEKNKEICKQIFKNFGQLYNLRVECHEIVFNACGSDTLNTHNILFKYI